MTKLSVVISAFNEEDKIRDCLDSVKWADEIVLVDNSSTDNTITIARKYTDKIFTRPNNPMLNINKNFGFAKANGDWILLLDSDERVTSELAREIKQLITHNSSRANGYWIPRKNVIFGKWIEHTGWYPDYQLRLFKKGKGKFPAVHVHEMIEVEGGTEKLTNHIEHLNYQTISQFLYKLTNIYTPNEARVLIKNGYKLDSLDCLRMPAKEFTKRFFVQEGYKDGLHGLVLSLLMAFYHLIIFVTVWEKKEFQQTAKVSLADLGNESKKLRRELQFWFITARINETKNILEKIILKFRRKIL